jgi:hypothetical protein
MNHTLLCKEMCDSHQKIVGAWAVGRYNLIASAVKAGFGEPDKDTQKNMSLQAQVMISIAEGNANLYGGLRYIRVLSNLTPFFSQRVQKKCW